MRSQSHALHHRSCSFGLRELVENVCQPLEPRLLASAIELVIDIPAGQTVTTDQELLRRAVRNLMLNAMEAMPHGGLLVATSALSQNMVELEIADTGTSLSDEERRQAFELLPTAQRGEGGWGLAVVRRIVESLGGDITVANCPEGGVAFTLRIPRPIAKEAAA